MSITDRSKMFCVKSAAGECREASCCPVCDCRQMTLLTPSWKNYYNEKKFFFAEDEWFAACNACGTVFRFPLISYGDFRKYGEDYYNHVNPGEGVEAHAVWHFESFQKPNYDSLRSFLGKELPPSEAKRWLDVGSIGYPTSFQEYDFTTIEPDQRIVRLGRKMFGPRGVKSLLGGKSRIQCSTIDKFRCDELFDGIVFHNSLYCLPFPLEGLINASRLLKHGGHLLVTISTVFCDAVAVRTDGLLSRIEDVLQGETLWVFYNAKSLEYLCQRAGFEFVSSHEIPAYGKKTMRVFRFQKKRSTTPDEALLAGSRDIMSEKLRSLFESFSSQSLRTLEAHNNPDTFFFGTWPILHDLARGYSVDRIGGFVVLDRAVEECWVDGVRCFGWEQFCSVMDRIPGQLSAVIASYKYQDEIFAQLASIKSKLKSIFRPNRKSGMESLFLSFAGAVRPSKGITLNRVD